LNQTHLERFTGAARLLVPGADDLSRFEVPARGAPGRAVLVVQPASLDEMREVVRRAVAAGVRLLPQGANTGLVGASVPPADDPGVVLSLDRLATPPDVDPVGATAVVAAGTRLSVLNAAAAEHGLHLPVDLAADPSLGGMVATNTGGSRVLRYGPMRHHVLGAELVAANAAATVFGHLVAVRKDSRGVDPVQLAVGSGGTLGVITRVTVALTPLPAATDTWWLALDRPERAIELLRMLERRRPAAVSAFELVARSALTHTLAAPGAPANPFGTELPAAGVLAEWSGDPAALAGVEHDLAAAAAAGLLADARQVPPVEAWALRHRVTEALRHAGTVLGHDVSVPVGALMALRDDVAAAVAALAPHAELCGFGHAGDGGLHLNVLFPHDAAGPSPGLAADIRAAVDTAVARHGGSYSAEHALGPVNAARWLASTAPVERALIAALKAVLDPHRLLGHPAHPYNQLP